MTLITNRQRFILVLSVLACIGLLTALRPVHSRTDANLNATPPAPPLGSQQNAPNTYDITGVWELQKPNRGTMQIYQEGSEVTGILITRAFAHRFGGEYSNPTTITGEYKYRRNRANQCATQMNVVITATSPNTISLKWEAQDSNCDLRKGQTGTDTLKRIL
jgi:hypothetical protein